MPVSVLGISAFYHDSAAAIVVDGRLVAALEEERVTRRKHDARLPVHAIQYCLEEANIDPEALDAIVFYDDAALTWDRVVRSSAAVGERARGQFREATHRVLGNKVWFEAQIAKHLGTLGRSGQVCSVAHHMSHAASAFYPSPYEEAAVLVVDGVGEWATTTIGVGRGADLELLEEVRYPHSLGLLYSAFTQLCGFRVNDGEYKLMGLAPYGRPRFARQILDHVVDVKPDGSFRLDGELFDYMAGARMVSEALEDLFEGPSRAPDSPITQREKDIAASVQSVLQGILLGLARRAKEITGASNLVMAGGVALNCVANGVIARSGAFENVWVQPAAGDAGGALGAALAVAHQHLGVPRSARAEDSQAASRLGPRFSPREVRAFLDRHDIAYEPVVDAGERASRVADALAAGKVVGLFAGRMETGPRALGARSILADPRDPEMQGRINGLVKRRESFRPFAPAVLRARASECFELDHESPYMLFVTQVRADHARTLPATTHVDGSARVQTVDEQRHPELASILRAFERKTGCPVVLNTSFNVKDEPIVDSPRAAYLCFERAGLDLLVLEDCLVERAGEPASADEAPMGLRATLGQAAEIRAELDSAERGRREGEAARVADGLFDAVIAPMHFDGAPTPIPLVPDPDLPTYFSKVRAPADPVPGPRSARALERRLSELWEDLPLRAEAAAACAEASWELRSYAIEDDELSTGQYVMF